MWFIGDLVLQEKARRLQAFAKRDAKRKQVSQGHQMACYVSGKT